jgi:hypothetical protein
MDAQPSNIHLGGFGFYIGVVVAAHIAALLFWAYQAFLCGIPSENRVYFDSRKVISKNE